MRDDTKSTIISTNQAFNRWGEIIKDKVLVTTIVDWLTHNTFGVIIKENSTDWKKLKKLANNTDDFYDYIWQFKYLNLPLLMVCGILFI